VLELDHVRAHPREQLRARRARLHVGHVEDSNSFECFHTYSLRNYFFFAVGFSEVMRPLSVPPPSLMTALMSVGRFVRIASSIAAGSPAGVVTCLPTPPKASIIFS